MLGRIFEAAGDFEVETARDGIEALEKIGAFRADVVTLDIQMPEMDGLACLDRIMVERPCPVVMVSALTAAGANETLEALSTGRRRFHRQAGRRGFAAIDELAPLILEQVRSAARTRDPAQPDGWPTDCACESQRAARSQR